MQFIAFIQAHTQSHMGEVSPQQDTYKYSIPSLYTNTRTPPKTHTQTSKQTNKQTNEQASFLPDQTIHL